MDYRVLAWVRGADAWARVGRDMGGGQSVWVADWVGGGVFVASRLACLVMPEQSGGFAACP